MKKMILAIAMVSFLMVAAVPTMGFIHNSKPVTPRNLDPEYGIRIYDCRGNNYNQIDIIMGETEANNLAMAASDNSKLNELGQLILDVIASPDEDDISAIELKVMEVITSFRGIFGPYAYALDPWFDSLNESIDDLIEWLKDLTNITFKPSIVFSGGFGSGRATTLFKLLWPEPELFYRWYLLPIRVDYQFGYSGFLSWPFIRVQYTDKGAAKADLKIRFFRGVYINIGKLGLYEVDGAILVAGETLFNPLVYG